MTPLQRINLVCSICTAVCGVTVLVLLLLMIHTQVKIRRSQKSINDIQHYRLQVLVASVLGQSFPALPPEYEAALRKWAAEARKKTKEAKPPMPPGEPCG